MTEDLMPVGSEAPRCSDFARAHGASPVGTGLCLERVVIVAVAPPWPKPALAAPVLEDASAALAPSEVRTRLFAAEPWMSIEPDSVAFEVYERRGLDVVVARRVVARGDLATDLADLAGRPLGDVPWAFEHVTSPLFMVCTQGSHDQCCGVDGVALADRIEADRPSYQLRRVSHTGGHRFAPTFLALPEARMWAFADLALVDRVASGAVTPDDLSQHCRGALGVPTGPAQVAENAVRAATDERWASPPEVVVIDHQTEPASYRCEVATESASWHVEVRVERYLPSIACEQPGGLPAKLGRDFAWSSPVATTEVRA